jgi:hypothetical protein
MKTTNVKTREQITAHFARKIEDELDSHHSDLDKISYLEEILEDYRLEQAQLEDY